MGRIKNYFNYTYAYPKGCISDDDIDLSDKVFYVGKGSNASRMDDHLREASNGCDCQKCRVIRWIWGKGKSPSRQIVFETLVEDDAFDNEKRLIQEVYNSEYLTNVRLVLREAISNLDDTELDDEEDDEFDDFDLAEADEAEDIDEDDEIIEIKQKTPQPRIRPRSPRALDLPFPTDMYEVKSFYPTPSWMHPDYQNDIHFMKMPAKIEHAGETYLNTKAACNFTGIGRMGTQFIVLGEEYGLNMFIGHNVTYYRKSDLLRFLDWANERYPGESVNPNFTEPEAPYGKQRNPSRHYQ